jgi:uncharacterized protein (DUF302 family)
MSQRKRSSGVALAVLAFAGMIALSGAAQAASPGVKVKANGSVEQVLASLKKMVADNGMMVMGELHQGKVLAMTGLKVESETVFVGNPTVGKELFTEEPGAGLVVPIRVNVYADAQGSTWVSYIPPSEQLDGYQNAKVSEVAAMLDGKLHDLVQMLGK